MSLVDPTAIRAHLAALHAHAAATANSLSHRAVIQLCTQCPDAPGLGVSAFAVGDVDHMARMAVDNAEIGRNCYCEARLVRPGLPRERGRADATLAVLAIVVDHDSDRDRAGRLNDYASITVETSPPANTHQWFLLRQPLDASTAKTVGDQVRQLSGADACSGAVTGCYRIAGSPNFVDQKKKARGRTITPTRLIGVTDKLWTPDELIAAFSRRPTNSLVELKVSRIATPAMDRSAVFMSAIHAAVAAGMTPDDLETLMRQHPQGCAAKYLQGTDRLRVEITRAWAKAVSNKVTNGVIRTRVAQWRSANRDHYRAYMRDYMRRRRSDNRY